MHWKVYNFKDTKHSIVKAQRNFKVNDVIMIEMANNELAIKLFYNVDYQYRNILKRGKRS